MSNGDFAPMRIAIVCAAAWAVVCPMSSAWPQNATASAAHAEPQFSHREIANASVVVLRIRVPAHAVIPQHDVTPRVVVWLTDARLKLTFPDGTSREETHRAGETNWVTPERHAGQNLSDKPIEFIAVIPARG